jgi:hypothetical protein
VGLSFGFQQDNDQHTSRLCKGYFTKKERDGMLHQMILPPQSSDLNQIVMVWNESDSRVKEKQPTSAHYGAAGSLMVRASSRQRVAI